MWLLLASALLISAKEVQCGLPYDPDNYLEVYPDPRDPDVLNGRTPLHFALIQSLGGPGSQIDGSGTLAGVKVALERINNDSSLLPGYTLHYTFTNSKCNRTVSLDALHSQIFHEPKKLAVIGAGCSVATEPTAEISHYYNITQISCVSSSGILGNRVRFPSYFQLLAIIDRTAIGYYGFIKKFGWRRIALIVQDENLWTAAMTPLKALLDNDDEVEYSEKLFNTSAGISALKPSPFDEDSRIFLLSMFSITALPFLCEAYHRGIQYPNYVVMTLGRFRHEWWRQDDPALNCTADQRERVMSSSIAFTESYFLNKEKDANLTTTPGITGREFFLKEEKFVKQSPLNITQFQYSQYCHDATWTLAYALNETLNSLNDSEINEEVAQAFNVSPPFRLEDFTYNSPKLTEIMFQHLSNTSFDGITGPVSFGDQGTRNLETIIIFQFRERVNATNGDAYLDLVEIGTVNENFEFMFEDGENLTTVWQGLIPYDGVPQKKIVTVHPALSAIYILCGCAGIAFAIACIIFNFIYRNARLIKIASTKLNYLIGIGAIILYVDTIFFVIPSTDPDVVNVFCNLTPWLTAIGYSLCYGTILAKMARVYYIFSNPSANKKIIKDRFLILGVAMLVAVDLTILVTYTLVEGIRGNLVAQEVVHKEKPVNIEEEFGIITNNFIYICDSIAHTIFLGILYGYKMLLQIFGLVLAFAIRKVKVKGLDDAKYIGVTIYVTSIVLAVTIVATYSLKDVINGFSALFCTGFLVGTSVILGLVFVPQMVGLYKDPKGESIFEKTTVVSHHTMGITKETGSKITEIEATGLRKRIKELENQVKELAATTKKEQETSNSIDSTPHNHSSQGSQVAEGNNTKEGALPRTIWDTPEEENHE